nr:putative GST-like protein YibF [Candidatus Pantoea persica]
MKLIGSYTSPFVRKISVILLEKGIVFEFINDAPYSPDSHVSLHNPLGKVPTLVDDEQHACFDSSIIVLLPHDARQALHVRQVERGRHQRLSQHYRTREAARPRAAVRRGADTPPGEDFVWAG